MGPALVAWNKEIENRVTVTSSIIQQIKIIKMIGLTSVVTNLVQSLRQTEIEYSKKFRILFIVMQASGLCFAPFVVGHSPNFAYSFAVLSNYASYRHHCFSFLDKFIQRLKCFGHLHSFSLCFYDGITDG